MNNRKKRKLDRILKEQNKDIEYFRQKDKKDKVENRLLGILLIVGVFLANLILPRIVGSQVSMNINPGIGPIDLILILTGVRFL